MRLIQSVLSALVFASLGLPLSARAASCTSDDFGAAVDSAGASLRAFNAEAAPRLQARLKALAAKRGWSESEAEDQGIAALSDAKLAKLDETANGLLAKVDTLSHQTPGQSPDCARLEDLKATGIELLAVMKAKTAYLMTRVDAEIGPAAPVAPPVKTADAASPPAPPVASGIAVAPESPPPLKLDPKRPDPVAVPVKKPPSIAAPAPAPAPAPATASSSWSATTAPSAAPSVAVASADPGPPPPPPSDGIARPQASLATRPQPIIESDNGYTIDEIRDATRGFFGPISTGLAAVIEHAFESVGRPTAYVQGQEGGGAFLGGLRYGEGTLYLRSGGTRKVYWHGPSVGFDVGAAGARTMFLVYKLVEPTDLMRTFSGIDGSAFVVGGVGITLLGGGNMILAPIRSGLGLRVGANIGYLRFTDTKTWNPF